MYTPQVLEGADATLAMYHDQGLTVLKHAAFGRGVNVTLGLPLVRTSVDHGTRSIARARATWTQGSLREALALALDLARPR
jgi:4-hydroxythreonine-4-phosphate dehydrogenase